MSKSLCVPSYRHHKPSGQAVVTLNGRDLYLGKHGSSESRAEYQRLVGEWLTRGGLPPVAMADLTIAELMVPYLKHAESYYVKDGRQTSEVTLIRLALRELNSRYGSTEAHKFGPIALRAVRQAYVDAGLSRRECNRRTQLVVRFFKWCVAEESVPPSLLEGLKAVPGLRRGKCEVRETAAIRPVALDAVDATLPHLPGQVQAMVQLQRLSGMRPGEVVQMRTMDLDRSGDVWTYTPSSHKTEHHGRERVVYVGPLAQEILLPWLRADQEAYLFQPCEVIATLQAQRRLARKTPLTCSVEIV
jgi:integrase